jgi:hypothetical protein
MQLLLAVLVVWLLLAVLGFLVHLLWIAALIVAAVWLFGFARRSGESARWYRW